MSQWLYDIDVELAITGDEFPKTLATALEVVALVGLIIAPVAAAVHSHHVACPTIGVEHALGRGEVFAHACNLAAVTPVRTRLDGDEVMNFLARELEVDADG